MQGTDERTSVPTGALAEEDLRRIVREEIQQALGRDPGSDRAAIIASKGTLDWAYPPLIIATATAATGMETAVFFTFYGLNILTKDFERRLKVGPTGNPAMPMPVPMPQLATILPGMVPMATSMMRAKFRRKGVAPIRELLDLSKELGVRLIACRMTMDVFGYEERDFIDGIEFAGAAAFVSYARKANVTLFI